MATEMGRMPFFYNQEGRLVQVDYALQAVSRGSTTLGLKTKDFAVLSSQVKPTRPLMEPAEKVFVVDEHIGATGSGYIGDVTTLLDQLRVAAQRHRPRDDRPDAGGHPPGPFLFSSRASALYVIHLVLLARHALNHAASFQVELRPFHVPRDRAVELPFELLLHRRSQLGVGQFSFPKVLDNRLLHHLVLRLADLDPSLPFRVERQDLLFHGAE